MECILEMIDLYKMKFFWTLNLGMVYNKVFLNIILYFFFLFIDGYPDLNDCPTGFYCFTD